MGLSFHEDWAEILALAFLAVGFVFAILLTSPLFSYLTIFISGFLAARAFYSRRFREPILPFIIIIIGFLFGYLVGGFWISRFWAFVIFILSFSLSYYLHLKKFLVIFKSKKFIK